MNSSELFVLPEWMNSELNYERKLINEVEQMNFVLNLAEKNVRHKTGGPFAAAVINADTNELVSVGVNLVLESNTSIAHAEIVAITLAERRLKSHTLKNHILVSSAQPCVMCGGAVLWADLKKIIYGAPTEDVEEIVGFDEGPQHPQWEDELRQRGIEIIGPVQREAAKKVLELYKDSDGIVY